MSIIPDDYSELIKNVKYTMPTGIEEAGLVLAAFPLLCSLIQQYLAGLETINGFIRYRRDLQVLLTKLKCEHRLFKTSCFLFLSPIGDLPVIYALVEDPGGQGWQDETLTIAVIRALGEDMWHDCVELIRMMHGMVQRIQNTLQKNMATMVQSSTITRLLRELLLLRHRISFTLYSPDRKGLLQEIRNCNACFSELLQALREKQKLSPTVSADIAVFKGLRTEACCLCAAIMASWNCQCSVGHIANLRLIPLVRKQWGKRLEIIFSYGADNGQHDAAHGLWSRQTASFRAETVSAEHLAIESIKSLCTTLKASQESSSRSLISAIPFPGVTTSSQRFLVEITSSGQEEGPRKAISVEQCLESSLGSGLFGTRDKLEFALALTSSLLWLHSSPWLRAPWTSKDILLFQNEGVIDQQSLRNPYVQYLFAEDPVCPLELDTSLLDSSIFALGMIFLQIVQDTPLEVLYRSCVSDTDLRLSKEEMARKVEPIIRNRIMSPTWRNLIRRCIYGIIDERNPTADLDTDNFLRLFYDRIILPLSEALAVVSGDQMRWADYFVHNEV